MNTKTYSRDVGRSCSEPDELQHGRGEHKGGTEHMVPEEGKPGQGDTAAPTPQPTQFLFKTEFFSLSESFLCIRLAL